MSQVLPQFVTQIGIGVPVTKDFHWLRTTDTAVVRCHDYLIVSLCQLSEEIGDD